MRPLFVQGRVVRSEAEWSSGLADTYVPPETLKDADLRTVRGLPGPPRYSRVLSVTSKKLSDLPVVKAAEETLVKDIREKAVELDALAQEKERSNDKAPFSIDVDFTAQG